MQTNLNLGDPMVTAHVYPANGYGPTAAFRIIGPDTYIAKGNETGTYSTPPRGFKEDATYVVPQYLGRSDFDPSVPLESLKAVTIGPPRPSSPFLRRAHSGGPATLRLTVSTFKKTNFKATTEATTTTEPANPLELLIYAAEDGAGSWSLRRSVYDDLRRPCDGHCPQRWSFEAHSSGSVAHTAGGSPSPSHSPSRPTRSL